MPIVCELNWGYISSLLILIWTDRHDFFYEFGTARIKFEVYVINSLRDSEWNVEKTRFKFIPELTLKIKIKNDLKSTIMVQMAAQTPH